MVVVHAALLWQMAKFVSQFYFTTDLYVHLVYSHLYKNITWMLECFPDTISEELEKPFENLDEVIDRLDMEMGNRKIESRMESIEKARLV